MWFGPFYELSMYRYRSILVSEILINIAMGLHFLSQSFTKFYLVHPNTTQPLGVETSLNQF